MSYADRSHPDRDERHSDRIGAPLPVSRPHAGAVVDDDVTPPDGADGNTAPEPERVAEHLARIRAVLDERNRR